MRPRATILPLALLALALPWLAACGGHGQQMPTEPSAPPASMAASSMAATAGDSQADPAAGGHGHGHGHHGGGNGGFDLAIDPDTWNTEWSHSSGNLTVFVRGGDVSKIDLTTLMLSGPAGSPLAPRASRDRGNQVVAKFSKSAAIALLGTVKPGDKVTLTLSFTAAGTAEKLTEQVRVVGPTGTGG